MKHIGKLCLSNRYGILYIMKQIQKKQERLEHRFEYQGYGFKSVYKIGEMFFVLNMEYKKENKTRTYLKTPQKLTEIMTPENHITTQTLQDLSIEWLDEDENLSEFLEEEFKIFQDLENYEDDPYEEDYF